MPKDMRELIAHCILCVLCDLFPCCGLFTHYLRIISAHVIQHASCLAFTLSFNYTNTAAMQTRHQLDWQMRSTRAVSLG